MVTHRTPARARGHLLLLAAFVLLALGGRNGAALAAPGAGLAGASSAATAATHLPGAGLPGAGPAKHGPGAPAPQAAWQQAQARAHTPVTSPDPHWTNVFPALYAASAVSTGEAWAVGENGHLIHLSNGAWSTVDPPAMHGLLLSDVSMVSAGSGWVVAGEHAFQYDGSTWTERSTGLGTNVFVEHIVALSANDVWGTGGLLNQPGWITLVHWDGSTWSAAGPVLGSAVGLLAIAMHSAADGWAAGFDYSGPTQQAFLLHWNGSTWTPVSVPTGADEFDGISAPLAGGAWVTGTDTTYSPRIYHYSGGIWTPWSVPANIRPIAILMLSDSAGWATSDDNLLYWDGTSWTSEYTGKYLRALAGLPGQVWAVGAADTVLGRSGGGPWTPQRGGPTTDSLYSVSAVSTAEAWAVGARGTVLHYTANVWQAVPVPFSAYLTHVQMLSATDGEAVGEGIIAHWDGATWAAVAMPATNLYGLAMLSPQEGWAVGSGGQIWHDAGGVWAPAASPVTATLSAVALDSPTHGWAVGGSIFATPVVATLLEYTGGAWVDRHALLPAGMGYVSALLLTDGGTTGWAVTESFFSSKGPRVLRLSHGVWSDASPGFLSFQTGLAAEALGEAWTTGRTTAHYAGGAWQVVALPADSFLDAISLVPGRGGWAVGEGGEILQYQPLTPWQRFYDVPLSHPFAGPIEYMAAQGIVSGYADNTFRPANAITRGQLAKMVVTGLGWPAVAPFSNTFADVPSSQPFYAFVETAYVHGVISGYTCGAPGEPCDGQHRPYFRPYASVTRGQLAKILVLAKGWGPLVPASPTFRDVPAASPFYGFVERAAAKGIVGGYACGGPGAPCPGIYFRPTAPATRGQLSKILYLALIQP